MHLRLPYAPSLLRSLILLELMPGKRSNLDARSLGGNCSLIKEA